MHRDRKHLYPPDWKQRARALKEACGWRCEHCGISQGRKRKSKRTGLPYPVYLCAAHRHLHDTRNPEADLLCLCPTCHGRYDYRLRMREWAVRLAVLKHRARLKPHAAPAVTRKGGISGQGGN